MKLLLQREKPRTKSRDVLDQQTERKKQRQSELLRKSERLVCVNKLIWNRADWIL